MAFETGELVKVVTAGGGQGSYSSSARAGTVVRVTEKSIVVRLHRVAERGCFLGEKEVRITKASGRVRPMPRRSS
jgi:hypothetical protein